MEFSSRFMGAKNPKSKLKSDRIPPPPKKVKGSRSRFYPRDVAAYNKKYGLNSDKNRVNVGDRNDSRLSLDNRGRIEANKRTVGHITLPIPDGVTDQNKVDFNDGTLNPLQVAGLKAVNTLLADIKSGKQKKRPFGDQDINQVFTDLKGLGVGENEIQALRDGLSGVAINQLGANVNPQSIITRASGQILQSNLELLFNNVTLRSFSFAFDFAPRNRDESSEVAKIIRAIKQGMSPRKGLSPAIFIKSPKLFKLRYMSGTDEHPFLHKMKTGVITDMSVNYTGSNTYATYDDGTPVHMTMQFTFKEINPIYADDYEVETINGNEPLAPGGGVGY